VAPYRRDINPVQVMIVLRLADLEPTVGKLTERRLDQGSNVSYRPRTIRRGGRHPPAT